MRAFEFDQSVVGKYASFSRSFTKLRAADLKQAIDSHYREGRFWPAPLLSLNPAFEQGSSVQELADEGSLEQETAQVFRSNGVALRLYRHQTEALALARAEDSEGFVVTTGTGSGKSLCFFIPIIDRILRARHAGDDKRRTCAIVVYPMNALANSQLDEVEKFLNQSDLPEGIVPRVARYTGQESQEERDAIAAEPPDILLTNYMMLEFLLTRRNATDRKVIENCRGLQFIVLDELHTYRGRQGADVAILIRRLKSRCRIESHPAPICIGTSATMASEGAQGDPQQDISKQRKDMARVVSRIFGADIPVSAIISESLRRVTSDDCDVAWAVERLPAVLADALPEQLTDVVLSKHPLAVWVELTLGLDDEGKSRSRRPPQPFDRAVEQLAKDGRVTLDVARDQLAKFLATVARPERERGGAGEESFMAFKLHRFISGAGDVLTTLKPRPRSVLFEGQRRDPNDEQARLYPTRFCRACGQEYMVVTLKRTDEGEREALPRDIDDTPTDREAEQDMDEQPGYLTPHEQRGDDFQFSGEVDSYPEEWREERRGEWRLRANRKGRQPCPVHVSPDGRLDPRPEGGAGDAQGAHFWFLPGRFGFCLACHDQPSPQARERNKLAGLSAEGRSSATTTLVKEMLRVMGRDDIGVADSRKRKILGFGDNRQDSALQAGHFNDSVFVTLLRSAILRAVLDAGPAGLADDAFGLEVQRALGYLWENAERRHFWMARPEVLGVSRIAAEKTLTQVLQYRVWADMRRGWRFTYPNLMGVDLVEAEFAGLDDFLVDQSTFERAPAIWQSDGPEAQAERKAAVKALLQAMLEGLAVAAPALDRRELERLQTRAQSALCAPWSMDARAERRSQVTLVVNPPAKRRWSHRDQALILRGGFLSGIGRAIKKAGILGPKQSDGYQELMSWLLPALQDFGILQASRTASDDQGWQIDPSVVRLRPGPAFDDPERAQNRYFRDLYCDVASELERRESALMGMESREHTAQVAAEQREWREWRFRDEDADRDKIRKASDEMIAGGEGTTFLPALFCSPTMELGVDISSLNAVYLRNVPPTPANYVQRAGRAGRSGQAASIVTYCAARSPHDQYYFQRIDEMAAGSVRLPALDLANEELVRAHLHAIWLAHVECELSPNIPKLLDLGQSDSPLLQDISEAICDSRVAAEAGKEMERMIDAIKDHFDGPAPPWLADEDAWLKETAAGAAQAFDRAFDRWRTLYQSAHAQREKSHEKLARHGLPSRDRKRLQAQLNAALHQIDILENGEARNSSDFYTYRYLATEGFLPGYNFPRLPLYAFIPRSGPSARGALVPRARFVAISEFGPRSLIYHEGRAYRVHKAKLPPGTVADDGKSLNTEQMFICAECGAGHKRERERCHACDAPLADCRPILQVQRIDNVETLPAERITANDEERVRQGFEIRTTFSWPQRNGLPNSSEEQLLLDGEPLAKLQYAPATDIMRLNLGLKRRAHPENHGFPIDPVTGEWARLSDEVKAENGDPERADSVSIVPIVQERKNALLMRFDSPQRWSPEATVTAQHALLRGLELHFQLEEGEVLAERLPERENCKAILIYEATEGGTGVLSQIVRDLSHIPKMVAKALQLMHYQNVKEAVGARDPTLLQETAEEAPCVMGCYRCLLSYYNQPDHEHIDRRDRDALDLLLALAASSSSAARQGSQVGAQAGETPPAASPEAQASGDAWLAAFERAGLKKPDPEPLPLDGAQAPYAWRADLVAAMTEPLPASARQAAAAKGFDLCGLPQDPGEGVPQALLDLLGGCDSP